MYSYFLTQWENEEWPVIILKLEAKKVVSNQISKKRFTLLDPIIRYKACMGNVPLWIKWLYILPFPKQPKIIKLKFAKNCPQYIIQQLHLGMINDRNYEEVAFVNEKIKNKNFVVQFLIRSSIW